MKKRHHQNRVISRLLEKTIDPGIRYAALGDFEEIYQHLKKEKNGFYAGFWLWFQWIKSVPSFLLDTVYWRTMMSGNYFKIAIRNLLSQKMYSLLNITGLAVGIACCVLIFMWVLDEVSFDRFYEDADQIYRITYAEKIGEDFDHYALCPFGAPPAFKEEIPEIDSFTRVLIQRGTIKYENKVYDQNALLMVDPSFLHIFKQQFIAGNPATALTSGDGIVLTESLARKIFNRTDVLGEIVGAAANKDYKVTGIIGDVPESTHLKFDYLLPIDVFAKARPQTMTAWLGITGYAYVSIKPGGDPAGVEEKFKAIAEKHTGQRARENGTDLSFHLQKMTDIHLSSSLQAEASRNGSRKLVVVFSLVAIFILIIAGINFINLATARSFRRAREVGIRKVMGASPRALIRQFLGESILTAGISGVVAILCVTLSLSLFNDLTGKAFTLSMITGLHFWLSLLLFILGIGILAGFYPAIHLSRLQPCGLTDSRHTAGTKKNRFRNSLVVFQFTISIFLIASTLLIVKQIGYMKNKDLGFSQDQVLVLRLRSRAVLNQFDAFKQELTRHADIETAAYSTTTPSVSNWVLTTHGEGKQRDDTFTMDVVGADFDYADVYGLQMVEGRYFSKEFSTDARGTFIINETAAEKLGWGKDTVGKKIGFRYDNLGPVVGVFKDFHYQSLRNKLGPLVIELHPESDTYSYLSIKLKKETDTAATIKTIDQVWKQFEPERKMSWFFLDERINRLYRAEEKLGRIFTTFAGLAMLVACLGLFGLASFTAQMRTKEIAIRKVLGASAGGLFYLLSREFMKWILVSNLIAVPVTYFIIKTYWLENFPYHISPGAMAFVISGGFSLGIALLTTAHRTISTALTNPIGSLRQE